MRIKIETNMWTVYLCLHTLYTGYIEQHASKCLQAQWKASSASPIRRTPANSCERSIFMFRKKTRNGDRPKTQKSPIFWMLIIVDHCWSVVFDSFCPISLASPDSWEASSSAEWRTPSLLFLDIPVDRHSNRWCQRTLSPAPTLRFSCLPEILQLTEILPDTEAGN